jgi:hypothetical protein
MTAVEWFLTELKRMQYFIGNDMLEAYNQALEMERHQKEKMYSEEDLKKAIDLARVFSKIAENDGYDEFEYTPIEIIQLFKKDTL